MYADSRAGGLWPFCEAEEKAVLLEGLLKSRGVCLSFAPPWWLFPETSEYVVRQDETQCSSFFAWKGCGLSKQSAIPATLPPRTRSSSCSHTEFGMDLVTLEPFPSREIWSCDFHKQGVAKRCWQMPLCVPRGVLKSHPELGAVSPKGSVCVHGLGEAGWPPPE